MPYVKKEYKEYLEPNLRYLKESILDLPEEDENSIVTYVFFSLIKYFYYCDRWERLSDGLKVLEDAKLEYYRRYLAPHADRKIEENGDVD
jgi:hypothetical protein